MATRSSTTLIVLTRQVILRADFSRGNVLTGLWTQARPDVHEWPNLIDIALGMGPRAGLRTFVLCSDLWTQTLTLTNISTVSMSPAEVESALNFEAESLSGQSAFESSVAATALPGNNAYWIVQARSADVERVDETIRMAGSKLGGLGHPGGVPVSLSEREGGPWVRVEGWPDAVLMLRGDGHGAPSVQVNNADPQMARWQAEWDGWRGVGQQEALTGPGVIMPGLRVENTFRLDDEAKVSDWLTAWAKHLTGKATVVPLFRPARKPMSSGARWAISLGMAAAVLMGCAALHLVLEGYVQVARAATQVLTDQDKQLKDLQKKIPEAQTKQKELQAQIDSVEKNSKVLATYRQRLVKLMETLRAHHPEDLFIETLEVEGGEPRLRGRCLHPELADQFASKLGQLLREHGWEVQAPKKEALKLATNGGPWSFEIQFRTSKEMSLDAPADTKKGRARIETP